MSRRDTTVVTGEQERESRPCDAAPTRPDPTQPLKDPSSSRIATAIPDEQITDGKPERQDVERLCALLVELMVGNGCRKPNITKTWRDAARLLIDRDGIDPVLAEHVLRWSQADTFWRTNIQSMPTFREKFDQLRLKRKTEHEEALKRAEAETNGLHRGRPQAPPPGASVWDKTPVRAERRPA